MIGVYNPGFRGQRDRRHAMSLTPIEPVLILSDLHLDTVPR